MKEIDEYFEKYPENIIGFRVNKSMKIIDVWINNNWEIPKQPNGVTIAKQKNDESKNSSYYILYSESFSFIYLFDCVSNIIEHNLDIERKQNLFKDKLNELKNLFTTLTYDELRMIQIETPNILKTTEPFSDVVVSSELNPTELEADDHSDNSEPIINDEKINP